jgi:hypothetical protein
MAVEADLEVCSRHCPVVRKTWVDRQPHRFRARAEASRKLKQHRVTVLPWPPAPCGAVVKAEGEGRQTV